MNMTRLIGRIVFGLVATGLAAGVWLSSTVIANQTRDPQFAKLLGMPPQGTVQSNLAFVQLALAAKKQPQAKPSELVSDRSIALARAGFAAEPLAVRTLATLALGAEKAGSKDRAVALFGSVEKLTRRNEIANHWRIVHFSQLGDEDEAFRGLDRIMRTSPRLLEVYLPALADGLARANSVEPLVQVMASKPEWSAGFWNEVTARPRSYANASLLRRRLADGPWGLDQTTESDKRLIAAMAATGQYDAAAALACKLESCAVGRGGRTSRLNNGSFTSFAKLPPFDWQIFATGDFGGQIVPKNSALDISALPETGGLVARQLVRLQPGRYVLGWSERINTRRMSGGLRARLTCASAPLDTARTVPPVLITNGTGGAMLTVLSACDWFWFDLEIVPTSDGEGFDLQLDAVSLRPAP